MAGTDGACQGHAGLTPTEAQQAASRANRTTDALYKKGLKDPGEHDLFDRIEAGQFKPSELRRKTVAMMIVLVDRAVARDAKQVDPDPEARRALERLLKVLPPEAEEPPKQVEEWEFLQKVEQVIADHPDLFLQRLLKGVKPEAAAEVHRVLREQGVLADAA